MRKNKKKKTVQYSKTVSLQLEAEDILEFLDFLKVAENNEIRCASANKIKRQLHELVLSRIECREPKAFIYDTEDFLMRVIDDKMVKIALQEDKTTAALTTHAIGEIMRSGRSNVVQNIGDVVVPDDVVKLVKEKAQAINGLEWVGKISEDKIKEVMEEVKKESTK